MADKKKPQAEVKAGEPTTLIIDRADKHTVITLDMPPEDSDNPYARFYRKLFLDSRDTGYATRIVIPDVL
jgi:hypothetical protein